MKKINDKVIKSLLRGGRTSSSIEAFVGRDGHSWAVARSGSGRAVEDGGAAAPPPAAADRRDDDSDEPDEHSGLLLDPKST